MKKETKEKISLIVLSVVMVGVTLWWLIGGIAGLVGLSGAYTIDTTNEANLKSGDYVIVEDCLVTSEVISVQHKVNMISAGTSCYILAASENMSSIYAVVVPEKECEKMLTSNRYTIKGKLIEPDDEISSRVPAIVDAESGGSLGSKIATLYIDTEVQSNCIVKIIATVLMSVAIGYIVLFVKAANSTKKLTPEANPDITVETDEERNKRTGKLMSKPMLIGFLIVLVALIVLIFFKSHVLFNRSGIYYF